MATKKNSGCSCMNPRHGLKRNGGCSCMNPRRRNPEVYYGTKRPATAEDFQRWEEKAQGMTDYALWYSANDAFLAAKAMAGHDPVAEGYYYDQGGTYLRELNRRKKAVRNPSSGAKQRARMPDAAVRYYERWMRPKTADEIHARRLQEAANERTFEREWKKDLGTGHKLDAGAKRRHAQALAEAKALRRPILNPEVHYDSDDYNRGLFQGAVEKGKAPPPPETSAELRRGYAAGGRISKARPNAVARAMGVFDATSDQVKAGQALRDAVLDNNTLSNPRTSRKRRNPMGMLASETPHEEWMKSAAEMRSSLGHKRLKGKYGARADLKQAHAYYLSKAKATRPRLPNPMSAAERKHLAHEKEEEKTFAAMMDKLPIGVTIQAGKHRVRKLSKGYVVVDGERLTSKQAAAKIHRGR